MTDTTVSLVNGLPGSRNFVTLSLEFLQKNKDGTATWKSYTKRVEVNLKESLDKTPPTITLAGAPVMNIAFGSIYTDPGATCIDNKDATCTVVTTGTVDTSKT